MWLTLRPLGLLQSHLTTFKPVAWASERIHEQLLLDYFVSYFFCIFPFSKSHLSGFLALSWRNLVKLKLHKVICLGVFIKLPRDIYILHQPFIAKVFARSPWDQIGKTGPICTAVLYSVSSLKAAEKPVTSMVFTSQRLRNVVSSDMRRLCTVKGLRLQHN